MEHNEQREQIARTSVKFGQIVSAFLLAIWDNRTGRDFTTRELELFVDEQARKRGKGYGFGTASRLLREYRQRGYLAYDCTDRVAGTMVLTELDPDALIAIIHNNGRS